MCTDIVLVVRYDIFPSLSKCFHAGSRQGALQTLTLLCHAASLQSIANASTDTQVQRSTCSPSLQPWEQSSRVFTRAAEGDAFLTLGKNPRGTSF